jgi:hypothetical protein
MDVTRGKTVRQRGNKSETDTGAVQTLIPADNASNARFDTAQYDSHEKVSDRDTPSVPDTGMDGATVSGRVLAVIPAAVKEMSGSFEWFTW